MGQHVVRSKWDNGQWAHITQVDRQADGRYQAVCGCGWRSEPQVDREAVGWRCQREYELLALAERLAQVYTVEGDQVELIGLVHEAQRLVGAR